MNPLCVTHGAAGRIHKEPTIIVLSPRRCLDYILFLSLALRRVGTREREHRCVGRFPDDHYFHGCFIRTRVCVCAVALLRARVTQRRWWIENFTPTRLEFHRISGDFRYGRTRARASFLFLVSLELLKFRLGAWLLLFIAGYKGSLKKQLSLCVVWRYRKGDWECVIAFLF